MLYEKEGQEFLEAIGRKIRKHRKAKRMTLVQMSKEVGLFVASLSYIERGERNIYILNLKRIAECLEVDIKDLL